MSIVILKDLSKKYADVTAVSDFNLTVENKEFVVLVGPSGCGKTTTLRMIAGLEDITSGTVEINGKVINNVHPKDRDIAMVFQNYALYPHMNVYKNISFGLRARKFSKSDIEYHTLKAAEILDLTDLLERKPENYQAVRSSVLRWGGLLSGNQSFSCLMNHCPIWTQNCGIKCALKLKSFNKRFKPLPST